MVKRHSDPFIKTIFREIKSSLGRYLAILGIIALGSGFFCGLKVTKSAMLETLNNFTNKYSMFDYRILSTLGCTDEDVCAFSEADGVKYAAGAVSVDVICTFENGSDSVLKAHSITDGVNKLRLTAGRMPAAPNECVADHLLLGEQSIGTTITLSADNDRDTYDMFAEKEFTVVGVVNSPYYINFERGTTTLGDGTVSGFIYVPAEAFDVDYYTEIFLLLDETGYVYSDEYRDAADAMEGPLTDIAEERAEIRYDDIVSDASDDIDNAKSELAEAEDKYKSSRIAADAEFADAWKQLLDARADLDAGWAEYNNSLIQYYSTVADAEKQLADAQADLDEAKSALDAGEQEYLDSKAKLEAGEQKYADGFAAYELARQAYLNGPQDDRAPAELEASKAALDVSRAELDEGWAQLEYTRSALDLSQAQYDAGSAAVEESRSTLETEKAASRSRLSDAKDELDSGEAEYANALDEYNNGKTEAEEEFADALEEIENAKLEIEDAEAQLAELKKADVYVLGRSTNIGYSCFESDSDIVEGISKVFPVFFFLVAALVCITTMNRMVDEQRTQIGVLKALGYGNGAIMAKYLVYTGSASLLGCAIGIAAGSVIFPSVIWQTYNIMYGFTTIDLIFDWPLAIISAAAYMLCTFVATWLSCRSELASPASELIRPKSPKAGKRILLERIPFIWRHVSFLRKVSIRNIMRYKKRMIMMILGISGCTALLLTGFGLNDSIKDLADVQFDEISIYDCSVNFKNGMSDADRAAFEAQCADVIQSCIFLHESSMNAEVGDTVKSVHFEVVSEGDISQFMDFHGSDGHIEYPGPGEAIINTNLAAIMGLEVGDVITLRDSDMRALSMKISGIFENIIYNYVFISPETVIDQWGETPEFKSAYVNFVPDADVHEAAASVAAADSVNSVSVNQDFRERIGNMLESMNYIVALVTVCALALAFIVLYNLTNINITERIREIATIKVLGFYPMESAVYVFRENMVLTVIGAVVGLGAGIWLHSFVMSQIVIDMMCFPVRIAPASYIKAVVLTVVFALIVDFVMYFRLERINMAESLKSIE